MKSKRAHEANSLGRVAVSEDDGDLLRSQDVLQQLCVLWECAAAFGMWMHSRMEEVTRYRNPP